MTFLPTVDQHSPQEQKVFCLGKYSHEGVKGENHEKRQKLNQTPNYFKLFCIVKGQVSGGERSKRWGYEGRDG